MLSELFFIQSHTWLTGQVHCECFGNGGQVLPPQDAEPSSHQRKEDELENVIVADNNSRWQKLR